ncbi:MAG TPA: alpha/beta hydrolase [Reyranella sp.]|nr:alpha/beta hydrolase [Reyranella sp.]
MRRTIAKLKRPFGNLHFEVTGQGPPLIFAHGLGGNQMSWWQQVAHFAPHFSCVTFAHRGFAPSDPVAGGGPNPENYASDLSAIIEDLGFRDVFLVGQSMGGWTVLEYAFAYPNRVRAVVLSSTSGTIDRRGADPSGGKEYDAWQADAEAKAQAGLRDGIHPALGRAAAEKSPALHLLYKHIDDMAAGSLDKERVRAGLRRTAQRTVEEFEEFRVPTLLIAGGQDIVFPPFLAPAIAARLPSAEAKVIPEAGHSPYFEDAATFNRLVEEFLSLHR